MICKFSRIFDRLLCLVLAFFSLNALANNYPNPPNPFYYVTDYTNTLNQQEWRVLEDALIANRAKTSSQIAVVIVPSTNGEEIASYSHNLFNKWGIGRKAENNGVLLLVAKDDRKLFIATGRGLEGTLPDAIASTIIRHDITPYFKQNQYAEGIAKGLSSIMAAINGEYAPYESYGETEQASEEDNSLLFFIIAGVVIVLLFRPRGHRSYVSPSSAELLGQVLSQVARNQRSSGGFGGGFSDFGGNRGSGDSFGGGSSGGGGAGGSW